jgi:hypothetical protein
MPVTAIPPNCFRQILERGYEFHVFISWPETLQAQGLKIVEQLVDSLEDRFRNFGGGNVFWNKAAVETGEKWDPKLRRSVSRSGILLAILLDSYFLSEYCRIEWNITETLQKGRLPEDADATCVIPLLLQEDAQLPTQLRAVQCDTSFAKMRTYSRNPNKHPAWNEAIEKLVGRIRTVLTVMCQQPSAKAKDWEADEATARQTKPKVFTWEAPASAPPSRPMRKLPRAVSGKSKL